MTIIDLAFLHFFVTAILVIFCNCLLNIIIVVILVTVTTILVVAVFLVLVIVVVFILVVSIVTLRPRRRSCSEGFHILLALKILMLVACSSYLV